MSDLEPQLAYFRQWLVKILNEAGHLSQEDIRVAVEEGPFPLTDDEKATILAEAKADASEPTADSDDETSN